jgi:hypothetical protein
MDHVGIVVEDLATTIEFFRDIGLELGGRAMVEGTAAGGRRPPERRGQRPRLLRVMFVVDDLDETLAGSASTARSLSAKWCSTKTCAGSATSAVPNDHASGGRG